MLTKINTLNFQPSTSLSVQWLIHPHDGDSTSVEILHPPQNILVCFWDENVEHENIIKSEFCFLSRGVNMTELLVPFITLTVNGIR